MPSDRFSHSGRLHQIGEPRWTHGEQLIAVVAEGERGRQYCAPIPSDTDAAVVAQAGLEARSRTTRQGLGFRVQAYGVYQCGSCSRRGSWWR